LFPISDSTAHHRSTPVVNITLIALNTLVFLYELLIGGLGMLGGGGNRDIFVFFHTWGFIPAEFTTGETFTSLRVGLGTLVDIETPVPTWATIFSSMFMHGGLLHFGGNMAFLWVFGDNIEGRFGHLKYLVFYLVVGVAATLSHWFINQQSQTPLVGASGAISGVLGAYLLLYPYNRIRVLVIFFLITAVQIPAMYMLGLWFLLQVLQGLGSLGVSDQVSVAFFAHIGGFVAGAAIVAVFKLLTGQPIWPPRPYFPSSRTRYWRGRPLD
jgi:membrane associated rhomboid family serine protease